MELDQILKSRRSIRDFKTDKIPEEIIDYMLYSALAAPSFQNRKCWRYIFVDETDLIRKLALNSGLLGKVNFFIKSAPLVVVACADPGRSGRVNDQDYYLVDVAISFQQMMLAAWDRGIGSCWLAAFSEKDVRNILAIPAQIRIVAMSPFGYPKEDKTIYSKVVTAFASTRKKLTEQQIFCWNKWKF